MAIINIFTLTVQGLTLGRHNLTSKVDPCVATVKSINISRYMYVHENCRKKSRTFLSIMDSTQTKKYRSKKLPREPLRQI